MFTRFSKKRQGIIDCIKNTREHPSAEWIYEKLKPLYPDLSLGTVYRNLGELVDKGIIKSVGTVQNKERFDGDVSPHSHVVCSRCGKITDVLNIDLPDDIKTKAAKLTDYNIESSSLTFYGLCADCKKSKI